MENPQRGTYSDAGRQKTRGVSGDAQREATAGLMADMPGSRTPTPITSIARFRSGQIPRALRNDPGWRSALYILEHAFQDDDRPWTFVDPEKRSIDFAGMLYAAGSWSHSERLLVEVASSLFNGDTKVDLFDLLSTLDDDNAEIVFAAMNAFMGWS
jgi:hypothetical protein